VVAQDTNSGGMPFRGQKPRTHCHDFLVFFEELLGSPSGEFFVEHTFNTLVRVSDFKGT
jgi:hypothetical protein